MNPDGSVPIGKTKLTSGEYSVEISSGSRTLIPFKAVIKPKSAKSNVEDISDNASELKKQDDTEFINLFDTQNEQFGFNQYQKIGQENDNLTNNKNSNIYEQEATVQKNNSLESDNLSEFKNGTASIRSEQNNDLLENKNESKLEQSFELQTPYNNENITSDNIISNNSASDGDGVALSSTETNQPTYRSLQSAQENDSFDNQSELAEQTENKISDNYRAENKNNAIGDSSAPVNTQAVVFGQTQVSQTENFGVTGNTDVKESQSFGVTGQTEVQITQNFGVTGEKIVLDLSNNGVKGDTSVTISGDFPINPNNTTQITSDKTTYRQVGPDGQIIYSGNQDEAAYGPDGPDNQAGPDGQIVYSRDQDSLNNETIYRQVGPDGQIVYSRDQDSLNNETIYNQTGPDGQIIYSRDQDTLENSSQSFDENKNDIAGTANQNNINENNDSADYSNKLTLDKMPSNTLQQENSQSIENQGNSDLSNTSSDEKSIYSSLPNQEYKINDKSGNVNSSYLESNQNINSNPSNVSSDQILGAKGESETRVEINQGALGEKTVTLKEYSSVQGEDAVNSRDFSGVKGESNVVYPGRQITEATENTRNGFSSQQQNDRSIPGDVSKKLIINKNISGNQSQNFDDSLGQTADSLNISESIDKDTIVGPKNKLPIKTVSIPNTGQNNFKYEDIQSAYAKRSVLPEQGDIGNTEQEKNQTRPVYKTLIDDSGNEYYIDEYGNKINDPDFSYEQFQSEDDTAIDNTRAQAYSTIDGVKTIGANYDSVEQSQYSSESDLDSKENLALSYQTDQAQKNNSPYTSNQNSRLDGQSINNQSQSVYGSLPLTNSKNVSKLTKSDSFGPNQTGVKNYNFIQKLSMTINKALGIEPQSFKDEEIEKNLEDQSEFSQENGATKIVSPRVTGLVESKDLEDDEDEERKNKRKRLRYQRVGYVEPDYKAPSPIKLDDETQALSDLYGERNRFETDTTQTNSALLRRAEEEIQKQSEAVKEASNQEPTTAQIENGQDIENIYYIELMKERARLEEALDDERESNRLAIRKSEDNIQQQLLDLILNSQNTDLNSQSNDPVSKLVQTLVAEDKNKNSEQVVIDATKIVQMIQNQITESNGNPIDEFLLRKRIEDELRSEFVYMQREQEKKMKLVYRKMLEDMYMDMINN